jgi:serine phosphatase RsbU (regulator of sigma subunit)
MTDRFRYQDRKLHTAAADIDPALAWLEATALAHGLDPALRPRLAACARDALEDAVRRGGPRPRGEVELGLFVDGDMCTLTVLDGSAPFEGAVPQSAPGADTVIRERAGRRNRFMARIGSRRMPRRERRRETRGPGFPLQRADGTQVAQDERHADDGTASRELADTALFRGVANDTIDNILRYCELRTAEAGEVLFRAGEHHRCVLVNLEGNLRVHLDAPGSSFFLELGAGESVGELSVCDGKPVSAFIVAGTPCRLVVLPEPTFLEIALAVPRISRNLVSLMSERMRRRDEHVLDRARKAVELETIQRELDYARQIQYSMLPVPPLFGGDARLAGRGFMRAARQVGGDFFDAFPLGDGRLFAAIGDVCGKGTPAALFMVRTLTVLRSEAMRADEPAEVHLARLAKRCNDILNESNEAQLFVTLFCAIVDPDAGTIDYVNAGHNPPLLRVPGAGPVLVEHPRNALVGIMPGLSYRVGRCDFPRGSLFVMYTDGVTEAENAAGGMFSDEALAEIVARASVVDAETCVDTVSAAVDAFAGTHPQSDDITLLALHHR